MAENETTAAAYRMNPAEDRIIFGDELTEGMWVLAENPDHRRPYGKTEDEKIRAQRFRQVTRLRTTHHCGETQVVFVGVWVDGYAEVHTYGIGGAWLARKDPAGQDQEDAPS